PRDHRVAARPDRGAPAEGQRAAGVSRGRAPGEAALTPPRADVAAAILAGGRARRMGGVAKPILPLQAPPIFPPLLHPPPPRPPPRSWPRSPPPPRPRPATAPWSTPPATPARSPASPPRVPR